MMTTPIKLTSADEPVHSPWGPVEEVTTHGLGIWHVATASHGGFFVHPELVRRIPAEWLNATFGQAGLKGWFEEDCDWCMVVHTFPDRFDFAARAKAAIMVHNWLKPKLARMGK